jgi:tRNA-Thr(GGU) m(6)t(6)A37 methyltransferase TsaA
MTIQKEVVLKPIGHVRTTAIGNQVRNRRLTSKIILNEELTEALTGIEDFSHLFVIFWMHQISGQEKKTLVVHPRGRDDTPLVGVLATRTPFRPNAIGLTLVELVRVNGNELTVRGLDAFDKTPILDVKPFDHRDTQVSAKVPEWLMRLDRERAMGVM